uniref:Secreted protein n=1 Tax=Arion vulgaris TaxID=1028688 RepID=A0A0B6Z0Q7_9EUPU
MVYLGLSIFCLVLRNISYSSPLPVPRDHRAVLLDKCFVELLVTVSVPTITPKGKRMKHVSSSSLFAIKSGIVRGLVWRF